MESKETALLRLKDLYLELESCQDEGLVAYTFSLAAVNEAKDLLRHFLENPTEYGHTHNRILYFTKMLELAETQIKNGGVQEGLWFGKSVISFFLDGTSAGPSSLKEK
ncbi:hypothetical protein ACD591_19960 [Rufibacter glacialis]|uniref:HEPN domain-containing protein n=1 Tax=Rufibacter glacialis TaxID=1259555 RepID=A0A5M8Q403_9BACT|nr:hypothetical protein [Rufibacter glacialis]KAA6430617.1 hypothetical protein FOE74_19270 [Rufibacter glacialis]GGK85194.1 hypothetical protein GCM10011405_36280 [Rufibacter glacialis]